MKYIEKQILLSIRKEVTLKDKLLKLAMIFFISFMLKDLKSLFLSISKCLKIYTDNLLFIRPFKTS